jgi:hypothetical protein
LESIVDCRFAAAHSCSFRGGIVPDGAPPLVNLDPSILEAAKPAIEAWKAKKRAAAK